MVSRSKQRTDRRYNADDDRYTPRWLLAHVEAFLGPDYFDPCPAAYRAAPVVNGLSIPWHGRVWCNPPYSMMAPWVTKAMTEPVDELLLLCPAYTETKWFTPLFNYPLCFIHGRVNFHTPEGRLVRAPHPSVLVYRGSRVRAFARAFAEVGHTVQPVPLPAAHRLPA